jgi:predicted dehydrogenase
MEANTDGAGVSRRDLLKGAAAASIAALAADIGSRAFADGTDTIKVGLVGCGGRGSGAFHQNVVDSAQPGMLAWAVGDVFIDKARGMANGCKGWGAKAKIEDRVFGGFDAYKKVIDSGIDLLVTATPPGWRPTIVSYAIEKGKNVFMEKPVGVDSAGIRTMLAAAEMAKQKGLTVVCGAQRRHQQNYLSTMAQILDGAIGEPVSGQFGWRGGGIWEHNGRRKKDDKGNPRFNLSWELDNWYHFTWLCGDQICEQHVHNIDVMNWCFADQHPTEAYGISYRIEGHGNAGRPVYSECCSGMAIEYSFPNGAKCMSWSGHGGAIDGYGGERIVGTKGVADCGGGISMYDKSKVNIPKVHVDNGDPYVQEHIDLINSIRKGAGLNEAKRIAESTFTAILGREAAYSGKRVRWDTLLKADFNLMPPAELLDLDKDPDIPQRPLPIQGLYRPGTGFVAG